jgi:CrcB protein
MIKTLLCVGIGGSAGAIVRFLISIVLQKKTGWFFPIGTLGVNIIGSFLIGFFILYFENTISPIWKIGVISGFLGALTTFSTFSYETIAMIQNFSYQRAALNIFLNVFLSLGATMSGILFYNKLYGGV